MSSDSSSTTSSESAGNYGGYTTGSSGNATSYADVSAAQEAYSSSNPSDGSALAAQIAATKAAEEAARVEAARVAAAQEAARVESARVAAAQEAARVEAARVAAEQAAAQEAARVEAARVAAEQEAARVAADKVVREQTAAQEQEQARGIIGMQTAPSSPLAVDAATPDVNAVDAKPTGVAVEKDEEAYDGLVDRLSQKKEEVAVSGWSTADRVMAGLSLIPGAQVLTGPYFAARTVGKFVDDATNPKVSAGQMVRDAAIGLVAPQVTRGLNGIIGQASGKELAQALGTYTQVATLNNVFADKEDRLPTSPGNYLVSKALNGQQYTGGPQLAANGDVLDRTAQTTFDGGQAASIAGSPPPPTATPTPAQAPTQAPAQEPYQLANGIIGNYLQWFNQGAGTLKQKGA